MAIYVRDRWQVSRKLTVNLGLRYEYYPLINRGDRGIERWDPATNIVYFGGLGDTPRDAGITVSHKNFAPRVGLAYRFGEKGVFRAGYGLTWDPLPFGRPLRGLYPSTLTGSYVSDRQHVRLVQHHQRGHPGYRHARRQQGPGASAEQHRHGSAQPLGRRDSPRLHPELERHV